MSTAAKLTLAGTTAGAIGIVIFVHLQQKFDQAVRLNVIHIGYLLPTSILTCISQAMHQGVIRDMEQQKVKRERQADFEMQRQLEEQYRKVQNVSPSGEE